MASGSFLGGLSGSLIDRLILHPRHDRGGCKKRAKFRVQHVQRGPNGPRKFENSGSGTLCGSRLPGLRKISRKSHNFIISVFVLQRTTTSGVTKPLNHHHWIRWGRIAPLQANCSGLKRGCARREPKFSAAPRFLKFGAWAPIQWIQKHLKTHQKEHCRACE